MNIYLQLTTYFSMLLSLSTMSGVILHDTNIDKVVTSILRSSISINNGGATKIEPGSTPHTHSDHISVVDIVNERNATPRSTPRGKNRKHLHRKRASRDLDGFNYHDLCPVE